MAILNILEAGVHLLTARRDAQSVSGKARFIVVAISLMFAALAITAFVLGIDHA